MDRGSINSFQINERLVGAGRFERPTPCAQARRHRNWPGLGELSKGTPCLLFSGLEG
jgi:hypothetical protein